MKRKRYTFFQRLKYSWFLDFTIGARVLAFGIILGLSIGSSTLELDTFLFVIFFGLFGGIALVITLFFRPHITLFHTIPDRLVCSETTPFTLKVKNISKSISRDVVIQNGELETFVDISQDRILLPILKASEEKDIILTATFTQRGSFLFSGFRADSMFPFGLFCMGRGRQGKMAILVYPKFQPLLDFKIPTGRRYQPGGVALASDLGESAEYIGNREYQDGDSLRDIDWKSWAKFDKPIVREYQEEYFCRVALVLDTFVAKKEHQDDFEASLSLSASIADFLSKQEFLIDIFAAGPDIYILEAGRALAHLEEILAVLACLDPTDKNPFDTIEPVLFERLNRLTTVIIVLLRLDEARIKFIKNLIGLGVGLKILICNSKNERSDIVFQNSKELDIQFLSPQDIKNGLTTL